VSSVTVALIGCQGADNATLPVSEAQNALPAGLDRAIVQQIGQAWIAAHPAEATPPALTAALRTAQRAARHWPWQPLPTLPDLIEAEYTAGVTVLPDGWVVAETEARCCARVALG
jgi:hypothetical protein